MFFDNFKQFIDGNFTAFLYEVFIITDNFFRCVLNFGLTKLSCKLTERPGSDGFGYFYKT